MAWSEVWKGKHRGRTLPEVALYDPDYLFFCAEKRRSKHLGRRFEEVCLKASSIRIPPIGDAPRVVDYAYDRFSRRLVAVEVHSSTHAPEPGVTRLEWLDLSASRVLGIRDIGGAQLLTDALWKFVLSSRGWKRLSRARCEAFFDDDDAFVLTPKELERIHDPTRGFGFIRYRDPPN